MSKTHVLLTVSLVSALALFGAGATNAEPAKQKGNPAKLALPFELGASKHGAVKTPVPFSPEEFAMNQAKKSARGNSGNAGNTAKGSKKLVPGDLVKNCRNNQCKNENNAPTSTPARKRGHSATTTLNRDRGLGPPTTGTRWAAIVVSIVVGTGSSTTTGSR